MEWIIILMGCSVSVEVYLYLPINKYSFFLYAISSESLKTINNSKVPDTEKQEVLIRLSGRLLLVSIKIFFLLLAMITPTVLACLIGNKIQDTNLFELIKNPYGIVASTIWAIIYYYIRRVFNIG